MTTNMEEVGENGAAHSLILIPDTAWVQGEEGTCRAVAVDESGQCLAESHIDSSSPILYGSSYTHIAAILPARYVTHLYRELPQKQLKHNQLALGYAIEDDLIAEPESEHIAFGPVVNSGDSLLNRRFGICWRC